MEVQSVDVPLNVKPDIGSLITSKVARKKETSMRIILVI